MARPRRGLLAAAPLLLLLLIVACSQKSIGIPRVDAATPGSIPAGRDSFIIVRGINFARGARMQIGTFDASATWINQETMTVSTGALQTGAYDVVVRNPDGSAGRLQRGLTVGQPAPATPAPSPGPATATPPPTRTPSPTPSPAPTPSPTPTPTPSPTPTPRPTPTPSPSPTPTLPPPPPTPSPSPTPSPTPTPQPLPNGALESVVCQPADFQNAQPTSANHLSNQQVAQQEQNPQQALQLLNQLGRIDGVRYIYSALPGERPANPPRGITTCLAEAYTSVDGASQVVRGNQTFPAGVQVQEVQNQQFGNGSRTFEGTIVDQRTGAQTATTVIVWQRNRMVGSVQINGPLPEVALPLVEQEVVQMDGRMARFP